MDQLLFSESIIGPSSNQGAPRAISRDEMNLAEFPLAVLSTRVDSRIKTLEFSDSLISRNGESIERKWIITGADKFGLPTSSDDEVLLGLMKLTVDNGFRDRKVFFSRYELLKILRWTTEGRSYTRLQRALDRLSGVRIKATNAFFDNEAKSHSTRNFGIIDAYEINDGRSVDAKPSFFEWSEAMFKSFQVGFIKKLDLDFYLSLSSAISKRLYRFLDKHFWYRSRLNMNLFVLAHEKVGVSRNYRFASSLRQQIDPALEELKAQGFIAEYAYSGRGKGTEVMVVNATARPRVSTSKGSDQQALSAKVPYTAEARGDSKGTSGFAQVMDVEGKGEQSYRKPSRGGATSDERNNSDRLGPVLAKSEGVSHSGNREATNWNLRESTRSSFGSHSSSGSHSGEAPVGMTSSDALDSSFPVFQQALAHALVERGIQLPQVKRLLRDRDEGLCERMSAIVAHFDQLRSSRSHLISRSPVGFLYRAMERPESFSLPGEGVARDRRYGEREFVSVPRGSMETRSSGLVEPTRSESTAREPGLREERRNEELAHLQGQYLEARKRSMQHLREQVEPEMLSKIASEVEAGLAKVRKLISPTRFEETLQHGIEEHLAKLFVYPEFDEWLQQTRRAKLKSR